MRRGLVVLAFLWAAPACAASVSPRPDSVTVTIYHDYPPDTVELARSANDPESVQYGLAFITETRTVDVPVGDGVIEFRGVASTIVPQTADIQGLPAGIIERNFDYDLLTPGSLLARSVGETVKFVRTDPKTGKKTEQSAIVRSAPDGTMLQIGDKLEAHSCSGLPEKLVFEKIPEGLRDAPTLSVRTHAAKAGRYKVKLLYIATGLQWSADYVAHIRPDGRTLDLSGFITLSNFSSTGFQHIPVEVVAGNVSTTAEDAPVDPKQPHFEPACWPMNINWTKLRPLFARLNGLPTNTIVQASPVTAAGQQETVVVTGSRIPASRLGDYKLYALPERTTVAAHQTKQIQFIEQANVHFERVYADTINVAPGRTWGRPAAVMLRLQNKESSGLGIPLPGGTISVVEPGPASGAILTGQHTIWDMSVGLPLYVDLGGAIDVRVRQRATRQAMSGGEKDKRAQISYEIEIDNDKTVPIAFELDQPLYEPGTRIIAEDAPHTVEPGGATWHFTLQPGAREVFHCTVEEPQS